MKNISIVYFGFTLVFWSAAGFANDIVHDAEHYILLSQHGEKWQTEERDIDVKHQPTQKAQRGMSTAFGGRLNAHVRCH